MCFQQKINFILIVVAVFSITTESFAKREEKINVVLIVIDAVRPDHLGCYGYNRNTSPNIDKIAYEGALFSRAFAQGSCTGVSTPSLFTSLYPSVHGALGGATTLPDAMITLPEILTKNGYVTAAFTAVLEGMLNFRHRFEIYDDSFFERGMTKMAPQVNKRAFAWLKNNQGKPFFLYLHYLASHDPYLPLPSYRHIFWQDDISSEMKEFAASFSRRRELAKGEPFELPERNMLDFIISQYDAEIRYVDTYIGALFRKLEHLEVLENTLIIILSDHGEEFFEHGRFFHGNSLYDELIHVPLIMRLPKALPRAKKIEPIVRVIDIMPSILDILDIQADSFMQGTSLLPLVKGEDLLKVYSFSQAHIIPLTGIRTDKWSFIVTFDLEGKPQSFELYDMEDDPQQINNLIEDNLKQTKFFKEMLKEYVSSSKKIRISVLGEDYEHKPLMLDDQRKEILKGLGYIQ